MQGEARIGWVLHGKSWQDNARIKRLDRNSLSSLFLFMSASAIIDATIHMLQASSAFGQTGAGKDYGILESTSGSCCIVQFKSLNDMEITFGNSGNQINWTFALSCFAKDLGDPRETLTRVTGIVDTVMSTIRADRTLQGTVEQVTSIRGERELPPGGVVANSGGTWLEVPMEIDCYEWPPNP